MSYFQIESALNSVNNGTDKYRPRASYTRAPYRKTLSEGQWLTLESRVDEPVADRNKLIALISEESWDHNEMHSTLSSLNDDDIAAVIEGIGLICSHPEDSSVMYAVKHAYGVNLERYEALLSAHRPSLNQREWMMLYDFELTSCSPFQNRESFISSLGAYLEANGGFQFEVDPEKFFAMIVGLDELGIVAVMDGVERLMASGDLDFDDILNHLMQIRPKSRN
jgi:hypothetical protein